MATGICLFLKCKSFTLVKCNMFILAIVDAISVTMEQWTCIPQRLLPGVVCGNDF